MKMKRYGVNVRETALQAQKKQEIYKSRGLHKAVLELICSENKKYVGRLKEKNKCLSCNTINSEIIVMFLSLRKL